MTDHVAAYLAEVRERACDEIQDVPAGCVECHGTGAVWADPPACTCGAGPACGIPGVGHEPYCGAEQCPNGCTFRSGMIGGGA